VAKLVIRKRILVVIIVLTVFISSGATWFLIGNKPIINSEANLQGIEQKELKKLLESYKIIKDNYVEQIDSKTLLDGAINGMVSSLKDPHSVYMDEKTANEFKQSLSSSFEGIGAEVSMENGKVTVIAPIKNTPAEKAGLKPRDQIISVNGESLEGMDLYEAVAKIRGKKGSEVEIEIYRPSTTEILRLKMVRAEIPLETIIATTIKTEKGVVGRITITQFAEKTADDFQKALVDLEKKGMIGLIIDVRDNPGGYLQSVLDIGNLLIPNKNIILQVEDGKGNKEVYRSKLEKGKYPIAIIVNKGSASASEILAAALQESGNYPVVGETSFGKGTVQTTIEMNDGSNIKLTIAKWLTPKGNWINHKGVKPNIAVKQPDYYLAVPLSGQILKIDMNNSDVKNLQYMLMALGFSPNRTDGYYDAKTAIAVKSFQRMAGLTATGTADRETMMAIQDKYREFLKDPVHDVQLQAAVKEILSMTK